MSCGEYSDGKIKDAMKAHNKVPNLSFRGVRKSVLERKNICQAQNQELPCKTCSVFYVLL